MFSIQTKTYGTQHENTIIVLAGWKTTQSHLWLLGQLLASYHFRTIIVTCDKDILTPDTHLTLERFIEVKEKVIEIISSLPKRQQKKVALFGMSQGTIIASMVAREVPVIEKVILNLSSSDTAEIIWSWDTVVRGFKQEMLTKKMTLPKLKKLWTPLAPLDNLKQSNVKQVLLYLAIQDEIIPYSLQEDLLRNLQPTIQVEAIVNERHSHFMSATINLLRFQVYVDFLKKPIEKHQMKHR